MSDRSSDGPSVAVSPNQSSLVNDDDDDVGGGGAATRLGELQLGRGGDDDDRPTPDTGVALPPPPPAAPASVQTRTMAQSLPRYVRPMREIPPRFRRLLVAETERMARLCQRLDGASLHVTAAAPSDAARQPTDDSRGAPSDVTFDCRGSSVDEPLAGHATPSSVVYVTAQSSSALPVYPPASVRVSGCNVAGAVDAASYVVPAGVGDPSLQCCGSGLPLTPAVDGLPPSVPMLLPSPVFYYHGASVPPPPDVGSTFSYVIPTPVVGARPQSGAVETGGPPAPVKNAQVVGELADVGVFHSAIDGGYSVYSGYYNSPGPELLPYCSLQLMHA